jgi:nitrite reductase/ring-hydroxylating ferredoxin subunit
MKEGKLVPLCGVSDVAPGCALRAESGGCVYAVFNVEGTIHVTQDECTHGLHRSGRARGLTPRDEG